jgi:tetrahydromethanopterin S-methyltransferase subunit C
MWHNVVLIGGVGLVASVAAWLICRFSGYTVAAWVAPLAITAFCLGLFVGTEYTTRGRLRVPLLSRHMHSPHLAHHSVVTELLGDFERMQGQLKAMLP